jgi:hypothetical protein
VLSRGAIKDAVAMENRGFGFVTFEDPSHAQTFLEVDMHLVPLHFSAAGHGTSRFLIDASFLAADEWSASLVVVSSSPTVVLLC